MKKLTLPHHSPQEIVALELVRNHTDVLVPTVLQHLRRRRLWLEHDEEGRSQVLVFEQHYLVML